MEMEKEPAAGYQIIGLPISGLQRKLTLSNIIKNIQLPFKIMASNRKVRKVIEEFNPDIVVGVGGFASEPTLKTATKIGYKTLLQEQNSYAGLTNKLLAKSANKICVAYEGMERFFTKDKIVITGNPVRRDIEFNNSTLEESRAHFGIEPNHKTILSIGGSLGARSINEMILTNLNAIATNNIQLIWQTGTSMYEQAVEAVNKAGLEKMIKVHKFISRMDYAYTVADIIISRAGAISISELCLVGKPAVLIPSPNVAEDHQTKNAMALVNRQAALMVKDNECKIQGIAVAMQLLNDSEKQETMRRNISKMAYRDAANLIVDEIEKIIK